MSSDEVVVICRACISECVEYKSLHKQGIIMGEVTTLATLLNFCSGLDFPADEDELPEHLCTSCVQKLARSYSFKKMVLEGNEVLRHHADIGCAESSGGEDVVEVVEQQHQQYVDVDGSEELQELATAAELKRDMEQCGEYVTMTVMDQSDDEYNHMEAHEDEEGEEIVVSYLSENGQEEHSQEVFKMEVEEEVDGETEAYEAAMEQSESILPTHLNEVRHLRIRNRTLSSEGETAEPPSKITTKTRVPRAKQKPPNPDFQCQVCNKQLSNINSFKYHVQLHSDATPYLCSLCGDGFKTRNAYEGHIILHDPNNPNTCELCGKSYRQLASLRAHMLTHTGEKPYICDICGKGMTQKSGYKKHLLTHTGEKPHTCDICGRDFRYSSNLIAHKRSHSGEKPHECTHCNKCFPTTEQLKRHTLVHTGEKPFNCEMCGKSFKRRSSLMTHRHSHESLPDAFGQKVSKSNVVEILDN